MEATILIKKNRTQLVLTPENDHDREVCRILERLPNTHRAEFYDCQGGWTTGHTLETNDKDKDLMIVFDQEKNNEE